MVIWTADDELLQLKTLTRAVSEAEPAAEVIPFSKVSALKAQMESGRFPDVAFLDIEMPGTSGVELARQLKLACPRVNIIFVTGFSQYAAEAFAIHTSGYVLKPVTSARVREELNNLRSPVRIPDSARLRVQTFGNFEAFLNGVPLDFKSAKAKELFALLVDRRGAGLTTAEIAAVLWEDREYSVSLKNQVQKVISLLRAALTEAGFGDMLVKGHNRTSVDTDMISCDLYEFLAGEISSINSFTGEYMVQYSWAEFTSGFLYGKYRQD